MIPTRPTAPAVARRRPWRRRAGIALLCLLLLLIAAEGVYLLRRPLFEDWIRRQATATLAAALAGDVAIGSIDGNWLTSVGVHGVTIRSRGVLAEVRDLDVDVQFAPLDLARSQLAGLRRTRVHVRALHLDLTAPTATAATPPTGATSPPDLGALASLLPDGAEIAVDQLTLQGRDARVTGPVHVVLLPSADARQRRLRVVGPSLLVTGTLHADGSISAELAVDDVARVPRLFAELSTFTGGRIEGAATLALRPAFACEAQVVVRDLRVDDRPVERLQASAHIDVDGLQLRQTVIAAPGVRVQVDAASMQFADVLASLRGGAVVELTDAIPYAAMLPAALRDQLPIAGALRLDADAGKLQLHDGHLSCTSAEVTIDGGSVRIGGHGADAAEPPIRVAVQLRQAERLPVPADWPLHPRGGTVLATVRERSGSIAVEAAVDLQVADATARTGRLHGSVGVDIGKELAFAPDLALDGELLAGLCERLRVHGACAQRGTSLVISALALDVGAADVASVRGSVPLDAVDTEALLQRSDLAAELTALPLAPLLQLAGESRIRGTVDGQLQCAGGAVTAAVRLAAEGPPAVLPGSPLRWQLAARMDAGALTLDTCALESAAGSVTLRGSIAGLGTDACRRGDVAFDRMDADLTAELELADLRQLDLSSLSPLAFGGSLRGRVTARGRLDRLPDADLQLQNVAISRAGSELLAGLDAHLLAKDGALQLPSAHAVVDGHELQLTAAIEGRSDSTLVRELALTADQVHVTGSGRIAASPTMLLTDFGSARTAAVELELAVADTDLAAVPQQLLGMAELTGKAQATVHVAGAIAAPEVTASVDLTGVAFRTQSGQRLDDINARVVVSPTEVRIERCTASRGLGPVRLSGALTAPGPLWQSWAAARLELAVHGERVLLYRRSGIKARADLELQASGPLSDLRITGDVGLRDGKLVTSIPLLDWGRSGGAAVTQGIVLPGLDPASGIAGQLDVRLHTAEPFRMVNNLVDGKLNAQMTVRGTLAQPVLLGTVNGPDTVLILPGMRMRATTLLVEFTASDPRTPRLTVMANGRRHGYSVQANVSGRYDRPEIVLTSDPPLLPDELMVLVTTGAKPDALRSTSGVGSLLGANMAQELAGWIFGSDSTEAKESFIDHFTVETGTEISGAGNESVVIEFRVLEHVFLQGERDVYEDINMGVVYRLRFK